LKAHRHGEPHRNGRARHYASILMRFLIPHSFFPSTRGDPAGGLPVTHPVAWPNRRYAATYSVAGFLEPAHFLFGFVWVCFVRSCLGGGRLELCLGAWAKKVIACYFTLALYVHFSLSTYSYNVTRHLMGYRGRS
jgi:hypothetical protein